MAEPTECYVDTVIVGAGASGLAAASRLIERGHDDFLVLEAQARVGGRIYTRSFGGKPVEIGAQWIHGEEGNVAHEIAKDLKQDNYDDNVSPNEVEFEYYEVFSTDGRRVPEKLTKNMMDFLETLIEDSAEDLKNFPGSVAQFLTQRVEQLIEKNNEMESIKRSLLDWFLKFQSSVDGCDSLFEVPAKSYDTYKECEGRQMVRWKNGYDTLIDYFLKAIPDDKVRIRSEVTNIDWKDGVTVTCQNGDKVTAKRVILTTSLGVLKTVPENFFTPSLPEKKKNVISSLSMGTVDKIFLRFPYRWWSEDSDGFCFVWPENDDNCLSAVEELKSSWVRGVFCFDDICGHSNVLCGWISGKSARAMEELTDDQVVEDCMKVLRAFLQHSYDIPDPSEVCRSSWYWNRFFRGSYSYLSQSSNDFDLWPADLAEPVKDEKGDEVILFAGEATHSTHFSTVHGAIETGWREADRILTNNKK